jgi:outer membrane protein, multidrug efflux system
MSPTPILAAVLAAAIATPTPTSMPGPTRDALQPSGFALQDQRVAATSTSTATSSSATADPPLPALSLADALAQAGANSLELRIARERLGQARTLSRKAWSLYLPQLTAGASYAFQSEDVLLDLPTAFAIRDVGQPTSAPRGALPPFDPARPFSDTNLPGEATSLVLVPTDVEELELQRRRQYGVQAELKQAIFAPQLWPAIRNAYLAEDAAVDTVEAARREVLFTVAQVYYGAAHLREAAAAQERMLDAWRRHETDAEHLVAQGAAPKLALLKARTDRARAEQDLLRTWNAYAAARQALATLLVRDPDFDVVSPPEPAPTGGDPAALEAGVAARRPDVRAASTQAELARGQRRQAELRYLPVIGVTGGWRWANVTGFTGEHAAWAVTLGLQWSILDGGLREAQLSEAGHRAAEADAAARLARNRARDEVRRAVLDLDSSRAALRKAEEQRSLAREALEQAQRSFAAGAATQLELADATSATTGAELQALAETLSLQLATLRVARAAGTFAP